MKLEILDFFANWCPPCQLLSPIIEELKEKYKGINFIKINIDEEETLTKRFKIEAVPTIIFLAENKEIKRKVGFEKKQQIEKLIEESFISILKESLKSKLENYARTQGFIINNEDASWILEALAKSYLLYKKTYCPCKIKSDENICPCKTHKQEIEERGICHCGLFKKNLS